VASTNTQTKFLYTIKPDFMEIPKIVEIDDKGWIHAINSEAIDPTPIEDYGDYLLADEPMDNAFEKWCKYCDKQGVV
jgi:hypothetical protein